MQDSHIKEVAQAHHLSPANLESSVGKAQPGMHSGYEFTRGIAFVHLTMIDVNALQTDLPTGVERVAGCSEFQTLPASPAGWSHQGPAHSPWPFPAARRSLDPNHHLVHLGLRHKIPRLAALSQLALALPTARANRQFALSPRFDLLPEIMVELSLQLCDAPHRSDQQSLRLLNLPL